MYQVLYLTLLYIERRRRNHVTLRVTLKTYSKSSPFILIKIINLDYVPNYLDVDTEISN